MAVLEPTLALILMERTMSEEEKLEIHNEAWNKAQCARIVAEAKFKEAQGFILREGSVVSFRMKGWDKCRKGTIIQNCSKTFPLVVIERKSKQYIVKAKRVKKIISY